MSVNNASGAADVVVIGGGPAGSTVSTLLAQHGYLKTAEDAKAFCAAAICLSGRS